MQSYIFLAGHIRNYNDPIERLLPIAYVLCRISHRNHAQATTRCARTPAEAEQIKVHRSGQERRRRGRQFASSLKNMNERDMPLIYFTHVYVCVNSTQDPFGHIFRNAGPLFNRKKCWVHWSPLSGEARFPWSPRAHSRRQKMEDKGKSDCLPAR